MRFDNPTKFVIDTNVLVSAVIFAKSNPRRTLDKVQTLGPTFRIFQYITKSSIS